MTTHLRCVAWLRGINVGGNNRILMTDLRAAFERGGFDDVATYIQSGNVVFTTTVPLGTVEATVEQLLLDAFGLHLAVVVRTGEQLQAVVRAAPHGFGTEPERFHDDVWFVKAPTTAADVVAALSPREGVDEVWSGDGVVYARRLSARRSESKLTKVVGTATYRAVTVRNWATTTKVLAMLQG